MYETNCNPTKWSKAQNTVPYGRKCVVGDVITVTLEFQNGKGILSFAVNQTDLGVAYQDLAPPLYPMAFPNGIGTSFTIID